MVHLGDITKMSGYTTPPVDVITFGSPCQDLSIAGKRAGMAGERSGLFSEAVRIIREMRYATFGAYPKYTVWENVPGAFSSNKGEDFHAVLQSLCRVIDPDAAIPRPTDARGGIKWPRAGAILADHYSLAWRTMDAQYWGVPQRRLRIALVLDLTDQRAGEILFEPESLRRHFAPGVTPGQGTPRTAENGTGTADCADVIPVNLQIATRHNALGERTGLGIGLAGDSSYTLQEGGGKGALMQNEKRATLSILQNQTFFVAEPLIYDARGNGDGQTSPTMTGDHNSRITDYTAVTLQGNEVTNTLMARDYKGVGRDDSLGKIIAQKVVRWVVRRLTPTECERLQGYPDGWTDLGDWVDSKGKAHKAADTPRYKALGNSIALPQWYYVLGGIADRLPDDATLGSLFDGIGGFPYVWAQLHNGRKELCVWASEIEEFPIAVTKKWFPEVEDGKLH